jgi:hypothetical protein
MEVPREDAPVAPTPAPGLKTAASQLLGAVVTEITQQANAKPPKAPRSAPGWMSAALVLLTGSTSVAGTLVYAGQDDDKRISALEAEKAATAAELSSLRGDLGKLRETLDTKWAELHTNDAALGRWAVDMSKDVSEGLVNIDTLLRVIAEKQGIDPEDIAAIPKPEIAEPGITVQRLGLDGKAGGL